MPAPPPLPPLDDDDDDDAAAIGAFACVLGVGLCDASAPLPFLLAAAPSSSIVTRTLPTGQMSPSLKLIFLIVPARGDGSSTVALSVITSTRGWSRLTLSPSLTFQATISPSTTPSPISGM